MQSGGGAQTRSRGTGMIGWRRVAPATPGRVRTLHLVTNRSSALPLRTGDDGPDPDVLGDDPQPDRHGPNSTDSIVRSRNADGGPEIPASRMAPF